MERNTRAQAPHGGQPIVLGGAPLDQAAGAVILVHGRGATAQNILPLGSELGRSDLAYLAPQASGQTWYPYSFMAPVERNEPGRSSALAMLADLVQRLEAEADIPPERVFLTGFSQGACLTVEFAARHPRRYGGVIAFTGGLIGPEGALGGYEGSLDGTPVFLGAGDPDPHVPWYRVEESADILRQLGAEVETRRYPGMPHTIVHDEVEAARQLIENALAVRTAS